MPNRPSIRRAAWCGAAVLTLSVAGVACNDDDATTTDGDTTTTTTMDDFGVPAPGPPPGDGTPQGTLDEGDTFTDGAGGTGRTDDDTLIGGTDPQQLDR